MTSLSNTNTGLLALATGTKLLGELLGGGTGAGAQLIEGITLRTEGAVGVAAGEGVG